MRCHTCKHDNDDTMRFCTQCGATLGGRKCPQGHTIPEGLTDCPFCPRPIRAPTAVAPVAALAPGGRKATLIVSKTELERSCVQPSQSAGAGRQAPADVDEIPSGGRAKTIFRAPGAPAARPDASNVAVNPSGVAAPQASAAPLVGFLVSFSLDPGGSFWPVRYGRTVIGAEATCDVVLPQVGISGRHAEVMVREDKGNVKIWLTDDNSTNGTKLNGADIFTDRPDVTHGDRIGIADVELIFVTVPRTAN